MREWMTPSRIVVKKEGEMGSQLLSLNLSWLCYQGSWTPDLGPLPGGSQERQAGRGKDFCLGF